MAEGQKSGLLDLEKELTCSICTDVLYQPLTLLDCLHTFCGYCLREWFSWQAANPRSSHPFSCPSCRATVRETRPNATVTTLLDMYLQANPDKGKTDQEKAEIEKTYKPGDNVLPKIERRRRRNSNAEDERILEEVRQRSLLESTHRTRRPHSSHRSRSHGPDNGEGSHRSRHNSEGRRRRRHGEDSENGNLNIPVIQAPLRQIEHQSSLRSLLSSSDADPTEIEEEILRQILDEGLLDGIDLDELDITQEDELSERIADAYRRRHRRRGTGHERQQSSTRSASQQSSHSQESTDAQLSPRPRHSRSRSAASGSSEARHPPLSRPHLLDASNMSANNRRRANSDNRRQTSPVPGSTGRRSSIGSGRQGARSVTDLSNRPHSSQMSRSEQRRGSENRSATDPDRRRANELWRRGASDGTRAAHRNRSNSRPNTQSPLASSTPNLAPLHINDPIESSSSDVGPRTSETPTQVSNRSSPDMEPAQTESPSGMHSSPDIPSIQRQLTLFPEPSISCKRCGKPHIEHEVHENCSVCNKGDYNICSKCYRLGRGCLHWYGFENTAWLRYQRQAPPEGYPQDHPPPHTLTGQCYLNPKDGSIQPSTAETNQLMTADDPKKRLQSGKFCDICQSFVNECFWSCSQCNEGSWGFCNDCVNQGRCCTHPLLPIAHISTIKSRPTFPTPTTNPSPSAASVFRGPNTIDATNGPYKPLTFSTDCNICHYPIPPSNTRYHCNSCNDGNYDICSTCYLKLVTSGRISKVNGPNGWRRCLKNHRMVVVGFEDHDVGQKRLIVKDMVGGLALKDDGPASRDTMEWAWRETPNGPRHSRTVSKNHSTSNSPTNVDGMPMTMRFPPDGGVGMRVLALWSYYPAAGVKDELLFPKGAEIKEVEDLNHDWYWGVYAGAKGLFPGNYVRVVSTE
ncbi:MAG: hypothetical protein M1834_000564 [Cirrosporium novae-zelandiae]|nr:MAG: hypothetical protein M1834_000564 [Cirrosporium novae-zelandiae]